MKNVMRGTMMLSAILAASLFLSPAFAKEDVKVSIKQVCSMGGGTYSSGSNYARCEYSNGDSHTCNTDVNQCETCTNGKCTVAIKRPGMGMAPTATVKNAPTTASKPARPAPAVAPTGTSRPSERR